MPGGTDAAALRSRDGVTLEPTTKNTDEALGTKS